MMWWCGRNCTTCIKRKSHPLGNIPTGHRWDRIAMDILDVCDPTPDGFRYILVIADYFSKWTEAFPIKNKCADTVADVLVNKIILRFGMPLVIHSDQGREFENGLMKSLCNLLGYVKTRTGWWRGLIELVWWCCPCLLMTGVIIGMNCYLLSCTHIVQASMNPQDTPLTALWWVRCVPFHSVNTEELRSSGENEVGPHPLSASVLQPQHRAFVASSTSWGNTSGR